MGQVNAEGVTLCGGFADEPARIGKKAAGRLLDGRQHHNFPRAARQDLIRGAA